MVEFHLENSFHGELAKGSLVVDICFYSFFFAGLPRSIINRVMAKAILFAAVQSSAQNLLSLQLTVFIQREMSRCK